MIHFCVPLCTTRLHKGEPRSDAHTQLLPRSALPGGAWGQALHETSPDPGWKLM